MVALRGKELVFMKINSKNITVEPVFKNYENAINVFIDRRLRSCSYF
jgi:hypothetical protein